MLATTLCGHCRQPFHLFGYSLVWEDEFNDSSLNTNHWNIEVNGTGCGNNELQFYVDNKKNVAVKDGKLVLTARKEKYQDRNFTSGRVNTLGKVTFTYGIIEARIKLPKTANGLWPAFWMMGNDIMSNGWPYCGETDILEMGHSNGIIDNTQDKLFNGALHWGNHVNDHRQHVGDRVSEYSLQDGKYHTFFVIWTPEKIEMYVDDNTKPYLTMDISNRDDKNSPGYYFHKPNFILVNLAVGGAFPNLFNINDITALKKGKSSMYVDYIRLYQKVGCNNQLTINDNSTKKK